MESQRFVDPLARRVTGVVAVVLGFRTLRLAPRTATGARRAIARIAAALVILVGALQTLGPEGSAILDDLGPLALLGLRAPVREALVAALLALASVWVWATSPAVRR